MDSFFPPANWIEAASVPQLLQCVSFMQYYFARGLLISYHATRSKNKINIAIHFAMNPIYFRRLFYLISRIILYNHSAWKIEEYFFSVAKHSNKRGCADVWRKSMWLKNTGKAHWEEKRENWYEASLISSRFFSQRLMITIKTWPYLHFIVYLEPMVDADFHNNNNDGRSKTWNFLV